MHDHGLVSTDTELRSVLATISGTPWLAIDTEFMREKTYFPQLCLIQIATPEHIACIDPLALADASALYTLLHDPAVLKVFHAAAQDLEVLYLVSGSVPAPVFDTQVAASLLGHGDQIGYANLVQAVLRHQLDKTQTRTDWAQRPLRPEQLRYAQDDVRYLVPLFERLEQELRTLGRLDWMRPEMDALVQSQSYTPNPGDAWRRVGGHKRLQPLELAVLRELAAWRETVARDLDRPRRWIISDDVLVLIARSRPLDLASLRNLRGAKGIGDPQAEEMLRAVRRGIESPKDEWPVPKARARPLSESEEVVVDIGMALLRELSRREKISPEAVASRKDMISFMHGDADANLGRGWRRQIAGNELQRWLDSHTVLRRSGEALEILDLDVAAGERFPSSTSTRESS